MIGATDQDLLDVFDRTEWLLALLPDIIDRAVERGERHIELSIPDYSLLLHLMLQRTHREEPYWPGEKLMVGSVYGPIEVRIEGLPHNEDLHAATTSAEEPS